MVAQSRDLTILQVDPAVLKRLDLSTSAEEVLKRPLDRFPILIIDRCLAEAAKALTRQTAVLFGRGWPVAAEVLTMPRKTLGTRPALLAFAPARVLYHALVSELDAALPPPTRTSEGWINYDSFGADAGGGYVAQMDIASCYEYVDHDMLEDELIIRSGNLAVSQAVLKLLGSMMGRGRGLPQMHWASDRLADTYLDILVRNLALDGHSVRRYVDDLRVPAATWDEANEVIERAAEHARTLGLALSGEKTRIYKSTTLLEQKQERDVIFSRYFERAREASMHSTIRLHLGPYEMFEEFEEIQEDALLALRNAVWAMFGDWHREYRKTNGGSTGTSEPHHLQGWSVAPLSEFHTRLDDDLLTDLVFAQPMRLEQVCKYVVGRAQTDGATKTYESMARLISNARRSPWATLWLLNTLGELPLPADERSLGHIYDWAVRHLGDRHETVRAEACWILARYGRLTADEIANAYREASLLTQPALAAATGLQKDIRSNVAAAIRDDNELNRKAYEWGSEQTQES